MIRLFLTLVCTVWSVAADGQAVQRSAQLRFVDLAPQQNTTYSVYQASGACPASVSSFTKVLSNIQLAPLNAAQPTIFGTQINQLSPGTYCFYVTATDGTATESAPSNEAQGTVGRTPPSGLTVTIF